MSSPIVEETCGNIVAKFDTMRKAEWEVPPIGRGREINLYHKWIDYGENGIISQR